MSDFIEYVGHTKVVRVYEDRVGICNKGMFYSSRKKIRDEKTIYLKDISALQFKDPGMLTGGYVEISFYGGKENANPFDWLNKYTSENVIIFSTLQEKEYNKLKEKLNKMVAEYKNLATKPEVESKEDNYLTQLEKLAELQKKGIITEEEFLKKKKEILGL